MFTYEEYLESTEYIRSRIGGFVPEVLMILGSGLGFMAEEVEGPVFVDYGDVPHMRTSTAPGHKGRFVFGKLAGKNVMVMQGRMHYYEGYTAAEAAYPVRVAKLLGVHSMIVTNAAGGINTSYNVGDLVLISDHIKLCAPNPLVGENLPQFGPRFCDMTYTYCREYRQMAKTHAAALGVELHEGVYFYFTGPQFETPAEIRAARVMGGDLAGMSTVYEAITANHCGMKILGISLVTNMAAGVLEQKLDEVDVLDAAEKAKDGFAAILRACLPEMKG